MEFDIFTDGETEDELKINIRDAVHCHFGDSSKPEKMNFQFLKVF